MGEMADFVLDGMSEPDEYGFDCFDNIIFDEETDSFIGPYDHNIEKPKDNKENRPKHKHSTVWDY